MMDSNANKYEGVVMNEKSHNAPTIPVVKDTKTGLEILTHDLGSLFSQSELLNDHCK
jgi:hypothetical protein